MRAARELTAGGWVVRYGDTPGLVPPGRTREALGPLPVAALRLPLDTLDLLAPLSVGRVAQLIDRPRDGP